MINVFDFETFAKEKIEKSAYDYYVGGAGDELTLNENIQAFQRIREYWRAESTIANVAYFRPFSRTSQERWTLGGH